MYSQSPQAYPSYGQPAQAFGQQPGYPQQQPGYPQQQPSYPQQQPGYPQQQPGYPQQPAYGQPAAPQFAMPQAAVTPEIRARFDAIDADHSGNVTASEVVRALSTPERQLPLTAARMLCRTFSESGSIRIEDFAKFDAFISMVYNAFMTADYRRSGSLDYQGALNAMTQMGLPCVNDVLGSVMALIGERGCLTYVQFITACSIILLSRHLMGKYDRTNRGTVTLDLKNLITFVLWFN